MNLRKVLAMVLTIAMVVGLIVVPTSAAVMETATLEELIPEADYESAFEVDTLDELNSGTKTSANLIVDGTNPSFDDYVTFGTNNASNPAVGLYWAESLPEGGAAYIRFINVNMAGNGGFDIALSNGTVARVIFHITGHKITVYNGGSQQLIHSDSVNTIGSLVLNSQFEMIIKDTGSGLDYYVRLASAAALEAGTPFTKIGENIPYPTASATDGTGVWTGGGTNRGNLDFIKLYGPVGGSEEPEESYTGTHTFAEVLNAEDPAAGETKYVFAESTSVDSYTANTTKDKTSADALTLTSIPLGGAAHYKFSGIENSMWAGGDGYIQIHGYWADHTQGFALYLGHTNAIRFNNTSNGNGNAWDVQDPDWFDPSKPFDVIIKDNSAENETTPVQLWISMDDGATFTKIGDYTRATKKSEIYVSSTDGVASTTISATVYTGESKTGASEHVGTHTFAQVLNTTAPAAGETAYVFAESASVASYTANVTNDKTGAGVSTLTSIPVGGAAHYKFSGVSNSTFAGGSGYIQIQGAWAGDTTGFSMYFGHSDPIMFNCNLNGNNNSWDRPNPEWFDVTKPFDVIIKDNSAENATTPVQFWISVDNGETFTKIGDYARAMKKSSIHVSSTNGVASTTISATVYTGERKTSKTYVAEDELLPKTGDAYYNKVDEEGEATVTSAADLNPFTTVTSIPVGGAVHYSFAGITNTDGTKYNYVFVTEDLNASSDSAGCFGLQIGGGLADNAISAYVNTSWDSDESRIAAKDELDITKPFELIAKYDGSTLTYYIKGEGDTGFWLAGETLTVGNHNSRHSMIQAVGASVANLTFARLYEYAEAEPELPVIEGTHTFAQLIDSTAPVADELKNVYTAEGSLTGYTTKSASDVNGSDIIASGTLTQDKSANVAGVTLIPGGGAAYYKIDGITLTGSGNQYIMIDFKWNVDQRLGGSFRIGRVNDADDFSIRGSASSLTSSSFNNHFADAQIDITKPFELIVKDLNNSNGEVQYWVKQSNAEKFRLIATYKYAQERTPSFQTTSGASAVFASAAVYSCEAKFGGSADLVELRAGNDLTSDPTGATLTDNWVYAIVNPSVAAGSALIFAGYKADESLTDVMVVDITGGTEYQIEEIRIGDFTDAVAVKAFLWDGINTMKPVAGYDVKAFTK